jgi:signal peptidase I
LNEGENKMQETKQNLSDTVKSLLIDGHSVELSAYGQSMIPFLRPGEKVQLTPIGIAQIVRGDLVAFQKQDYLVIHRVHDIILCDGSINLVTKGDSNLNPDEHIDEVKYLAKVTAIFRRNQWRELTSNSIHSRAVLFFGKLYSLPFWLWKHGAARFTKG